MAAAEFEHIEHTPEGVTAYLHAHIPLTQHMGARVTGFDQHYVRIAAPLAPNLNHRETAFGGSIASLCILAGWTLAHLRLDEQEIRCRLVIYKTEILFNRPVDGDFEVVCTSDDESAWTKFFEGVRRKGKARISMDSAIEYRGRTAAALTGTYVAIAENSPPSA